MPLTYKSFQISPEANICTAALTTNDGALMNIGLMSCNVLPTSSQISQENDHGCCSENLFFLVEIKLICRRRFGYAYV